jgi:hypothetical protein
MVVPEVFGDRRTEDKLKVHHPIARLIQQAAVGEFIPVSLAAQSASRSVEFQAALNRRLKGIGHQPVWSKPLRMRPYLLHRFQSAELFSSIKACHRL